MKENIDDTSQSTPEPQEEIMESTPVITENNNTVIKEESTKLVESYTKKTTGADWFAEMKWKGNPFTFSILPELFVGYRSQLERVLLALEERHKLVYLAGPTGSGKTTFLKWLEEQLPHGFDVLYVAKPPQQPEKFIDIFNNKYKKPWYVFWNSDIKNLYEIPEFLNEKLKGKHLVVMFDEAHESEIEVLEWLRVLGDQVDNISVLLSGLPILESHLKDNLETFRKRIAAKIELVSLTKEEMISMIRKRIQHAGGSGSEFSLEVLDFIFAQSGGFPREVLRICDELVNQAILSGTKEFSVNPVAQQEVVSQISLSIVDEMTPMQKEVVELLAKNPMSPGDIANAIDLTKYKSRQHAVRSMNNVMKKLYEDGYLERRRSDKAYIYSLSGKLRTIVVKR